MLKIFKALSIATTIALAGSTGEAFAQTNFRGAVLGMSVPDAVKRAAEIGFHVGVEQVSFRKALRLSLSDENERSCASFDIDMKWPKDWDSKLDIDGHLIKGKISVADVSKYTIDGIDLFPCYFDASAVDVDEFIKMFQDKYDSLSALKLTRGPGGFYTYADTGSVVLKGGEVAEFFVPPAKIGGFVITIRKAEKSELDAAQQVNPKF